MHRWSWVSVAVLGGCTGLNGAFDESQSAATGDGSTVGETLSPTTGGMKTTGSASAVTSVGDGTTAPPPTLSSGLESNSVSVTGEMSATGERPTTSSGSTQGWNSTSGDSSSTGDESRVVFIYAANNWMAGDNLQPVITPNEYCVDAAPGSASLCESAPVAVLRQPDLTVPEILQALDQSWLDAPVFGIGSNGMDPLADSPAELLNGLEVTLAEGGVNVPDASDEFYSGEIALEPDTCDGWSNQGSTATTGSFLLTDGWFSYGTTLCTVPLPILCACLSGPDPFS